VAEKLAELLHATVKIDADGAMGKAGARGDFGAGHTFDETQDERFAIRIRQRTDGFEDLMGLGWIDASCGVIWLLTYVGLFVECIGGVRLAMKIDGAITGDGGEPSTKAGDVAKGMEAREGLEEDILNEVIDRRVRNSGEENAVDHAGVTGIKHTEGGAIAALRGLDEGDISAAGVGGGVHGSEFRKGG
jgi:hypothetical protein